MSCVIATLNGRNFHFSVFVWKLFWHDSRLRQVRSQLEYSSGSSALNFWYTFVHSAVTSEVANIGFLHEVGRSICEVDACHK